MKSVDQIPLLDRQFPPLGCDEGCPEPTHERIPRHGH